MFIKNKALIATTVVILIVIVSLRYVTQHYLIGEKDPTTDLVPLPVIPTQCSPAEEVSIHLDLNAATQVKLEKEKVPYYKGASLISHYRQLNPLLKEFFLNETPSRKPSDDYPWYIWKNPGTIIRLDQNYRLLEMFAISQDFSSRTFEDTDEVIDYAWNYLKARDLLDYTGVTKNSGEATLFFEEGETSTVFEKATNYQVSFTQLLDGQPVYASETYSGLITVDINPKKWVSRVKIVPVRFIEQEKSLPVKKLALARKQVKRGEGIIARAHSKETGCPREITLTEESLYYIYNPRYSDDALPGLRYSGPNTGRNNTKPTAVFLSLVNQEESHAAIAYQKLKSLVPYREKHFVITYNNSTGRLEIAPGTVSASSGKVKAEARRWIRSIGLNPSGDIFSWQKTP